MSAIEINKLRVRFGEKTVIDDFSLAVPANSKLIIQGASGSGKSTLLACILGFVVPDQGSIYIHDTEMTAGSIWELRKRIAYVGQEPELGIGLVSTAVQRPFTFHANRHLQHKHSLIPELMEKLLLPRELLQSDLNTLSGGEKQRLTILLATILERPILLLDEPSSALDNASRQAVLDYLDSHDELTILTASHDPAFSLSGAQVVKLPANNNGDS